MKKSIPSLLLIFLFLTTSVFSQDAKPTAPPIDDDVVKISTTLIQIDVSVTDKSGKIVSDLKPEDFEIYENGKKQDITNFSFIFTNQRQPEPSSTRNKNREKLPDLPPATLRPEQVKRTIALVVDDITLSFSSTFFVREALKKFVDEQMQDDDLVAIIRTGGGIGALQQFSYDRRQLRAAIEKIRWNPSGMGNIGTFTSIQDGSEPKDDVNEFRESIFASGTLGALNYVIRGMRDLPGRKSVMLFSDGLPLFITGANGMRQPSRILDSLRRLTDLANRASVVIYTMDAKGLEVGGLTAEDNTYGVSAAQVEQKLSARRDALFNSQEGLIYLARQTGGLPIINQSDINKGIRRMLDDQKGYYLLGYQPDSETFDPKTRRYNKLEVKLKREDLRVRYRSGFFGITDEQARPSNQTAPQIITAALTSPFAANDITLRLNAVFGNDASAGSFVNSFLHIDANDLKFEKQPDGNHRAIFNLVAMSFGDNGLVVDELSRKYTMTMKEETYRRVLETGFVYNFTFPVKKPGAYQFRVVLHDSATNKVGSANQFIEVPNLKKERLTLSGIALDNSGSDQREALNQSPTTEKGIDNMTATSLRRFRRGTIVRYGYEIYNAKSGKTQKPQITTQAKVFRDGKVVFEGKPMTLDVSKQTDFRRLFATGILNFSNQTLPGDYVLQIVVTDNLAKEKRRLATQYLPFEIVE
ncbi:MAG TPA: VWA domain-containing protein [Pyrinomonadaceae bacterium]